VFAQRANGMQPFITQKSKPLPVTSNSDQKGMPRFEKSVFDMKYNEKKETRVGRKDRSPSPVLDEMHKLREREKANVH
jgi:hypothetical protein